ncbi:Putative 115 kDa protein in type-1 retrotransposable element R1DM [Eumeta japonica]|uniref:115 kDa protein in type-1 retrotransposable element R1DM n=1 Tax=Eumeta variegata TaxID=151549 RepID=A0A4C1XWT3_EUMVA|nr:Putative 115 kDa protein in type-1 retrotransposable element R1DM [Eumeta japonica]
MGCPQGSVLEHMLCNLLLSDIFRLPLPGGCKLIAYADDVTAVIEGENRTELEKKGNALLSFLVEWGRRNRLAFSPTKSATMTIKIRFQLAQMMKTDGISIAVVTYDKDLLLSFELKHIGLQLHARTVLARILTADLEVVRHGEVDRERIGKIKREIMALYTKASEDMYDI